MEKRGAEALVRLVTWKDGQPAISKQRLPKAYRHPVLDARLCARRRAQEVRILTKARVRYKLPVPELLAVEGETLYLEYVMGPTLKEHLDGNETGVQDLLKEVGRTIGRLHGAGIVHGDLTSSNLIVGKEGPVLLDFGLASTSKSVEDRAVDLYVLERAFSSTHPEHAKGLEHVWEGYMEQMGSEGTKVMTRLALVQQRGRKRDLVG